MTITEEIIKKYYGENKRYRTLNRFNSEKGMKLYKAAVNCGFTCPNKDGTAGTGGCIFCSDGSRLFTADSSLSVTRQLEKEEKRIHAKTPDAFLCAYFQTNTNTYAPTGTLRRLYYEAISFPDVKEISIATRPDCIPDSCLELLKEINEQFPLTVELGLQTVNDKTAKAINRGYLYPVFEENFLRLKNAGIRVCVHIIDGLPGESESDMLLTAQTVGRLKPDAVKIHLLYVTQGTALEKLYRTGLYTPMSFEEYTHTAVKQLELLPPETVIERITGDGDKRTLIAPLWSADKIRVLGTVDKIMAEENTYQGARYEISD